MNSFTLFSKTFLFTSSLGLIAILFINFYVDPLSFYRLNPHREGKFHENSRYQNPGLIKHTQYDTLLVGSSVVDSIDQKALQDDLDITPLKISVAGSHLKEQFHLLRYALGVKSTEKVFWAIEITPKAFELPDDFPKHLYDSNPLNDTLYLLSWNTLKLSFQSLFPRYFPQNKLIRRENLNRWRSKNYLTAESAHQAFLNERKKYRRHPPKLPEKDSLMNFLATQLRPFFQSHPNVDFYLYFPSKHKSYFRAFKEAQPEVFREKMRLKSELMESLGQEKNLQIFDFEEGPYNKNPSDFHDIFHPTEELNLSLYRIMLGQGNPDY